MRKIIACLIAMVLTCTTASFANVRYSITEIGTIDSPTNTPDIPKMYYASRAFSINNNGQVVGRSYSEDLDLNITCHAFIYDSQSGTQYIGTLDPHHIYSVATAISDNGQITGKSSLNRNHAFIYDSVNGMRNIGTLGGLASEGNDINNNGQIVGKSYNSDSIINNRAFLYDSENGMIDLGTLGGERSEALGINNSGVVVGISKNSNGEDRGFIYDSINGMRSIEPLDGNYSRAQAINDNGQVVGNTSNGIFIYDIENGIQDLGVSGSALSINDNGQIVGYNAGAFVYDSINGKQYLNDLIDESGWKLEVAYDINNQGQIVGYGRNPDNQERAFLLTPVPEPATLALITTGAAFIVRKRRS